MTTEGGTAGGAVPESGGTTDGERRRLESAEHADACVVDEDVDGAGGVDGGSDAFGPGHVERHEAQARRRRQDILARRAHAGDDARQIT